MSLIRPFRAFRPHPSRVQEVAAVPYDVVNRNEAKVLARNNPWSFLHVSRPEIDLEDSVALDSDAAYEKAIRQFKWLVSECPFVQDRFPSLYVYTLKMGDHEQTGVVGTFSIQEYEQGIIKKHEKTRRDKEDDRSRHTLCLGAQTGPVYLAYRDVPEVLDWMSESKRKFDPLYHFTAEDGIQHSLWQGADTKELVRVFGEGVPSLYIADGHHRAAASFRVYQQMIQKARSGASIDAPWKYFLAVAFPSSQLRILPYHRVVKTLGSLTVDQFKEKVGNQFHLRPGSSKIPNRGELGMYLKGGWFTLIPKTKTQVDLDVDLLQNMILQPFLEIADPRTDPRLEFVGGIRGTQELERWVNSGEAQAAFSLHPTTIEQVMAVSDRGGIMPPKSTWFEPKLRDGLFCHMTETEAL